jgi:hypothetical protein
MTLDFIGGVILMTAILVNVYVFTNALRISPAARIVVVAVAGVWTGVQMALYQAGAFQTEFARSIVPLVGTMVVAPLIIVGIAAAASQRVRDVLIAVPTETLIGLNAMRVFGSLFLFLAAADRLSGPFPQSAGWGDVIAGFWAIPLAISAARGTASARSIFAWNVFAAADLIAAIGLGVLSAQGNPLQIFAAPGSEGAQHMPYLLIPTVLVPFYLITHGIVFAQLRARSTAAAAEPSR